MDKRKGRGRRRTADEDTDEDWGDWRGNDEDEVDKAYNRDADKEKQAAAMVEWKAHSQSSRVDYRAERKKCRIHLAGFPLDFPVEKIEERFNKLKPVQDCRMLTQDYYNGQPREAAAALITFKTE